MKSEGERILARIKRGPTLSGPVSGRVLAHWRELERTELRRRRPSLERYARERDAVLTSAQAAVGGQAASLEAFPWTRSFSNESHCLGDLRIHLVDIPPGLKSATAEHAVPASTLQARGTLFCYPASWAVQLGRHPTAVYEDKPIDYFEFAPNYLRITTRDVRVLVEGVEGLRVLTAVNPALPEPERKLTEYAFRELAGFCHPSLWAGAHALFAGKFMDVETGALRPRDEIFARFAGTLLCGYSYGCTVILQQLNAVKAMMRERLVPEEIVQGAFARMLCVFIAPNVDFERFSEVPKVVARSPLDAVITGHEELELYSTVMNDRSSDGFSSDELDRMMKGELEGMGPPLRPIWIDPSTAQFNFALPGIVQFDADGKPLHPFNDCKHGHDIKPYIQAMRQTPRLLDAIRHVVSRRDDGPVVLTELLAG